MSSRFLRFGWWLVPPIAASLIAIIPFGAYEIGHQAGSHSSERHAWVRARAEQHRRDVITCFDGQLPRTERARCVEQFVRGSRDDFRAERDLEAQRAMARWAMWLLLFTALQVPIALGGTIALLVTIRQNRKALEQTKRTSDRQLRPYVAPSKISLEDGASCRVEFLAQNNGLMPAENVQATAALEYVTFPMKRNVVITPDEEVVHAYVPPGGFIKISITVDLSPTERALISSDKGGLLCRMDIEYQPLPDGKVTTVSRERIFVGEDMVDGEPRVVPEWAFESEDMKAKHDSEMLGNF